MYPLIAVLQHLAADRTLNLKNDVLFIGRGDSIEARLAAQAGLPFAAIQAGGLRSLRVLTQVQNSIKMMQATGVADTAISNFKPDAVLATGGYVSAPALWAASRQKIPIVIELPDLEPGWAVRALWRLSKQIAVSFDEVLRHFPRGRATVTGYPVRAEFYQATRADGRAHFQFDHDLPLVTVFGGSQGAHALNQAVQTNLRALLEMTQVLHISGAADLPALQAARAALPSSLIARYQVFEYLRDDMPLALAAADVVVARAGAATLGEFPAVGVPSILVPGLFAQGHQERNADFLAVRGAAIKLPEEKVETALVSTLSDLLSNRARLNAMTYAAKSLARPDAAERIGNLLTGVH